MEWRVPGAAHARSGAGAGDAHDRLLNLQQKKKRLDMLDHLAKIRTTQLWRSKVEQAFYSILFFLCYPLSTQSEKKNPGCYISS